MYLYEQGRWIEVLSSRCKRCAPHRPVSGPVSPRSVALVPSASTLCADGTQGGVSPVVASPSSLVAPGGEITDALPAWLFFFFF